jgi:putative PIN family toxin of toxin-antitoxin system
VAIASQRLLDELTMVLTRPTFRRWVSIADAVAFVDALAGTAELRPDPEDTPPRVRDQHDDYLVALAEAVDAAIVTGDADLLDAQLNPPAITPRALLDALGR